MEKLPNPWPSLIKSPILGEFPSQYDLRYDRSRENMRGNVEDVWSVDERNSE